MPVLNEYGNMQRNLIRSQIKKGRPKKGLGLLSLADMSQLQLPGQGPGMGGPMPPRSALKNFAAFQANASPYISAMMQAAAAAQPAPGQYSFNGNPGDYDAQGINKYNRFLARPDANLPIGEGPGFWALDLFGSPVLRSDWVSTGESWDPWDIRGEDGHF